VTSRDGPFLLLVRSFYGRLFESDLLPEDSDLADALSWIVPLFAAPAAMVSLWLFPKYALVADIAPEQFLVLSRGDRLFFIGYSMAAVGFVTSMAWQALFPDRRDAFVLGLAPVRPSVVVAARVTVVSTFVLGFASVINVFSAVIFAFASAGSATWTVAMRHFCAHLAATLGASLFVFLSLVALQATCVVVLPARVQRIASVGFQLVFVVTLLQWVIFSPGILARLTGNEPNLLGSGPGGMLPPVWFLGVYEALLGNDVGIRATAISATALAFVASVCAYGVAYRISSHRVIEGAPGRSRKSGFFDVPRRMLYGALLRDPLERAVFEFTLQSFSRSQRHRLAFVLYVGIGLSFIVGGFLGPILRQESIDLSRPDVALLSLPLVLSFFTVLGLRVLFGLPTELEAGWIFRMTEADDKRSYLSGVRKALLVLGVAPIAIVFLPLYAAHWGLPLAVAHTGFWCLVAAILTEAVLWTFRVVPFTRPYVPGRANLKLMWPLYLLTMTVYTYAASLLAYWILLDRARWLVTCTALVAAVVGLRVYRSLEVSGSGPLVFDDDAEREVQRLGIAS
jgi:hypothetical protein